MLQKNSDEKSVSLLSIALQFITLYLSRSNPERGFVQTPLKMPERPTFTMMSSYTHRVCIVKQRYNFQLQF